MPQTSLTLIPDLAAATFDRPPAAWLPTVAALLDEQRSLCEELEALGAEQSSHVAAGRTDDLLVILSRRQTVLDRVVEINTMLDPFRDRREQLMGRLPAGDREGLQRRIDAIADSVDRVRKRDDQDRRLLEEQRRIVADEISGLSRLRGAAAAYVGSAGAGGTGGLANGRTVETPSPRFHDRHG